MAASKARKSRTSLLLYADSEADPDMLYLGGVSVPDAFVALVHEGRSTAVLNQLEFGRVSRTGRFDEVLLMEDLLESPSSRAGKGLSTPAQIVSRLAARRRLKSFRVASGFPAGLAFELQQAGFHVEVGEASLFPERELKNDREAACIREGNAAASAGFRVVEKHLREASIKRGYLYHEGRRLTAGRLQQEIAKACLERGALADRTIVAGGDQACDPHCRGDGPLKANQFIIVDIFPRISRTGYHGDMTRTYLKGQPSDAQSRLYQTVFEAQQWALGEHRSGKSARLIYLEVCRRFEAAGYPTGRENGNPVGFIHGLGHGLGLAVHEAPRVNAAGSRLRAGQVVTVEPGLYFPGLGGVRVEDVVRIRRSEPEMLSSHPYRWHFR